MGSGQMVKVQEEDVAASLRAATLSPGSRSVVPHSSIVLLPAKKAHLRLGTSGFDTLCCTQYLPSIAALMPGNSPANLMASRHYS